MHRQVTKRIVTKCGLMGRDLVVWIGAGTVSSGFARM